MEAGCGCGCAAAAPGLEVESRQVGVFSHRVWQLVGLGAEADGQGGALALEARLNSDNGREIKS
jgi:hypothetical protein